MSAAQKFKKEPTPLVCPRNLPLSTRPKISLSSFFIIRISNNAKLCLFYMVRDNKIFCQKLLETFNFVPMCNYLTSDFPKYTTPC